MQSITVCTILIKNGKANPEQPNIFGFLRAISRVVFVLYLITEKKKNPETCLVFLSFLNENQFEMLMKCFKYFWELLGPKFVYCEFFKN